MLLLSLPQTATLMHGVSRMFAQAVRHIDRGARSLHTLYGQAVYREWKFLMFNILTFFNLQLNRLWKNVYSS